jgi:RNase P/RNase MRP subunit p29
MKRLPQVLIAVLIVGLASVAQAKKQKDDSGIKGRIVSVSPKAITIKERDGQQATIKIDQSTTIEVDGVTTTFSGLQAGQHVRVQGGTDGAAASDIQATSHKGKHKKST